MPSTRLRRRALTLAVVAFVCVGVSVAIGAAVAAADAPPDTGPQSATAGCIPATGPAEQGEAVSDVADVEMVLSSESW